MNETAAYYKGRVAIVTGGASGIGLALGETMLAYEASHIILADFNDLNLARETERLNAAYQGKVLGCHCDVTKEEDVRKMMQSAVEFGGGRIDFLFNNAGAGFLGPFEELTNEDWEKAFALNFYGALYGIRSVLPIMRAQGSGHIVNIISGIAFFPMASQTMYSATKAALNGLTLALRYELWDDQIRVTSATPGMTITAIWKDIPPPAEAQSAEQSATRILAGVAKNERIVLGDDADLNGIKKCFDPDAAEYYDAHLLSVARKRKSGEWVF